MSDGKTSGKVAGPAGGLPVGGKLGKHEIVERLGAGGQSIVYKAHDPLLDRFVAIKQVAPQLTVDGTFLDRFRDIVRRLSKLGCEGIVTIHELIDNDSGTFVVMEFVPGHNIETTLAGQPDPVEPKAVLQILWRVAAGLAEIHKAGIIHRDIKPGNIIVGEGLRVKITDFGVAARAGVPASMRLGTTKYMAPELFAGTQVDGRADIYSLGMIAYEMLLGREKFNQVFHEIVRDPHSEALRWMKWHSSPDQTAPPAHEVNPSVPEPLSLIVAKMLAKDPEERFSNVEALGREIRANFSPRAQRPAGRGPARRRAAAGAAAGAHAAGAGILAAEGEELVVPGELAVKPSEPVTAAIPKPPMSLKRKLVIAGVVAASVLTAVIVLAGLRHGQRTESLRRAETTYAAAKTLYDKAALAETAADKRALYGQALEKYREILSSYPGLGVSEQAKVKGYACRAHLAVLDRNWKDTDRYIGFADELVKGIDRAGNAPNTWVRRTQLELSDFRDYWFSQRQYHEGVERAQKARDDWKLRMAEKILLEEAAPAAATPEQVALIESLRKDIKEKEKQEEYSQLVERADEQAAEGDVTGATASYDQALKLLEDGKKTLDVKIYNDLKRTAETKKNVLLAKTQYRSALKTARRLEKQDRLGAAKAYNAARALFESYKGKLPADQQKELAAIADPGVLADKARDLEHDHWLQQGRAHLAAGRTREAQRDLEKARKLKDSSAVQKELAKIQQQKDYAAVVRAADKLYWAKNYPAALEKYNEALKSPSASRTQLQGKIIDCRYHIELTAAQGYIAKAEWDQAKASLLRAKRIKPANSAQVDAMLQKLADDRSFARLMSEAEKARKLGRYGDAIARLTEAKKIRPKSKELDDLIKRVRYEQHLEVGRTALEEGQYAAALAYFRLARGFMTTDELDKLTQQAQKALEEEGGD